MDEEDAEEGEEGCASRRKMNEAEFKKGIAKTKGHSEEGQRTHLESGDARKATKELMKKKKAHCLFNQDSQSQCRNIAKIQSVAR